MTTQPKRTPARALTTRQKVALPVAAAIYGGLAHVILDVPDGDTAEKVVRESLQLADAFLRISGEQE